MLFKNKYRIESSRLKGYDYSRPGAYYITIITKHRKQYFGEVVNGEMILNQFGKIANDNWKEIPDHFPYVILDEYIIMPDHMHGIIFLDDYLGGKPILFDVTKCDDAPKCVETPKLGVETPNLGVSTHLGVSTPTISKKRQPLGIIINQFKRACTLDIRDYEINFGWQSRFHDHIIRNENDLNRIRKYIIDNPKNWKLGKKNYFNRHDN